MALAINNLAEAINGTTGNLDTSSRAWTTGDLIVVGYGVVTGSTTATQAPTLSAVSGFTIGSQTTVTGGWDVSGATQRGVYLCYAQVTSGGTGVLRVAPNGTNLVHQRALVNKYDAGEWSAVVQSKATATGLTGTGAKSIILDSTPAGASSIYGVIGKSQSGTAITAGTNYTLVNADADINTDNSDMATEEGTGSATGTTFGFDVAGTNCEYGAAAIEVSEAVTEVTGTDSATLDDTYQLTAGLAVSDSATVAESGPQIDASDAAADFTLAETASIAITNTVTDSFTLAEGGEQVTPLSGSDSATIDDLLSTLTVTLVASDSFSMDDVASVQESGPLLVSISASDTLDFTDTGSLAQSNQLQGKAVGTAGFGPRLAGTVNLT